MTTRQVSAVPYNETICEVLSCPVGPPKTWNDEKQSHKYQEASCDISFTSSIGALFSWSYAEAPRETKAT